MEQARDVGFETAVLGGRGGHAEKLFERIIVATSDLAAKRRGFKVRQAFCDERFMPVQGLSMGVILGLDPRIA
jgi:hypothetical protein